MSSERLFPAAGPGPIGMECAEAGQVLAHVAELRRCQAVLAAVMLASGVPAAVVQAIVDAAAVNARASVTVETRGMLQRHGLN